MSEYPLGISIETPPAGRYAKYIKLNGVEHPLKRLKKVVFEATPRGANLYLHYHAMDRADWNREDIVSIGVKNPDPPLCPPSLPTTLV